MTDEVIFSREKHIGLITLNRPQALNALTLPMILAMQEQLQAWQEDKTVHAVVVRSSSEKAFCAGGDVRWLYEAGKQQNPQQMQFFWHEYRLNHFIHQYKKPYISLMNGVTMGGGVGISLHGSHPVATEAFTFAMPETAIGFFPDIGASYLLARTPGEFGVYLGLTGNRINAAEAWSLGLVKTIIPAPQLEELLQQLIDTDLAEEPHQRVNDCLHGFSEYSSVSPLMAHKFNINQAFTFDKVEAICQFLQEGNQEWHHQTLSQLRSKSPLSLKVTLAQIKKAKSMRMADCVKMDYCLVGNFMRNHDFYEGVRALLIDKDKSPHWLPKTLAEVSDAEVLGYFVCNGEGLSLD